ncbi:SLAP domain-containing protein [Lactobacillus sp. ESL0731]|uniref:SLAP domain-containing protein n=1 Tax=unclassified Lactobacillus TaxID=2620435 RepID=UPI0023F6DF06|nr:MULTISPECIES: SLAP domain-containing protein [unclassified Lactobacillus]WEV50374.1 SLAP domain-containing protein [Lactobacillus sp. ESL0700]WEV61504.1 SLAP domain-containing protein [Lactobacillus sp. ESL0731]
MKKKLLLGLVCAASLSLGFNITQVGAATTDQAATQPATTATDNSNQQPAATTGTTDANQPATSDKPAADKPNNGTSNGNSAIAVSYLGKNVKLKRNSYVYNKSGKRVKKRALKKNTIVTITGMVTVKGKSLLQINNKKNQYINANNVKSFKVASYKAKRSAFIYNSKGKRTNSYYKKGTRVPVIKTKKINGTKYVGVSETGYVKWSDLNHKSWKIVNQ